MKVIQFREEFLTVLPYHITESNPEIIDNAYDLISVYYDRTIELDKEAKDYNNLETLFEL